MRPTYANRRTNRRETDPHRFSCDFRVWVRCVATQRTRPCDRKSTRRIRAKGTAARIIGVKLSVCAPDCDDFPHRLLTGRRPFPSSASNHCKRCKSEPQIAADVILKIISRGLTTTRPAFVNEQRSGARVLPLCKNEERLREITGCARFWCDPSGNSLKVIARPVKISDAILISVDARTRNP